MAVAVQARTQRRGKLGQQLSELQVLGSEVVPPLADAVRLVHGDQRTVEFAQQRAEAREGEPLGRRVDDLKGPPLHVGHALAHLPCVQGCSQEARGDAAGLKSAHLVVHQGDERRDHQRGSGQKRGGELIDQALATARRRHQQQPPGTQQSLDGLALAGAKSAVAEPVQASLQAETHAALEIGFGARLRRVASRRGMDRHGGTLFGNIG